MTDFSSLYMRGAALIVCSMIVQWFGSTYLASRMYSTPDEGRDFGSGFAFFGAVSSAWIALLATVSASSSSPAGTRSTALGSSGGSVLGAVVSAEDSTRSPYG